MGGKASPEKVKAGRLRWYYSRKARDPEFAMKAAIKSRAWYEANTARANKNNLAAHYMREYGLTLTQVAMLKDVCNGLCWICYGKTKSMHIDHCHVSGHIRGVLCSNCNRGLGHFKDSPKFLMNAIRYLAP